LEILPAARGCRPSARTTNKNFIPRKEMNGILSRTNKYESIKFYINVCHPKKQDFRTVFKGIIKH